VSPSRPFIERPVATGLLMLAIVLAGLVGLRFLPLAALPQVDYPTIQVQTLYPGASPEVMSRTVTAPLERQFGQMSGAQPHELDQRRRRLDRHAAVRPHRDAGRGRAAGAGRHQRRRLLPAGRPAGAAGVRQGQPGRRAILTLAISSDTMPLTEVQNLVNTRSR
jgi:multidrug efflux pump